MGTICAPSYANIFMNHIEKKYIYPFLQGLSLIYLRFIDDIFFIWTGTKKQLTNCWNNLNKKHNSIKFEYKISQTCITFLDTKASIQNKKFTKVTKIYRKSTDRQNLLHIDSEHPKSLKDNIPYSQALRIKQICITPNDFNYYCEELKQRFVGQGDKPELINKYKKAVEKWKELLKEGDDTTSKETKIPLVLTYMQSLSNISKVVCKHWNILKHSKKFFKTNL